MTILLPAKSWMRRRTPRHYVHTINMKQQPAWLAPAVHSCGGVSVFHTKNIPLTQVHQNKRKEEKKNKSTSSSKQQHIPESCWPVDVTNCFSLRRHNNLRLLIFYTGRVFPEGLLQFSCFKKLHQCVFIFSLNDVNMIILRSNNFVWCMKIIDSITCTISDFFHLWQRLICFFFLPSFHCSTIKVISLHFEWMDDWMNASLTFSNHAFLHLLWEAKRKEILLRREAI